MATATFRKANSSNDGGEFWIADSVAVLPLTFNPAIHPGDLAMIKPTDPTAANWYDVYVFKTSPNRWEKLIDSTLSSGGSSLINWREVGTSLVPNVTGTQSLGDATHRISTMFMASKIDVSTALTVSNVWDGGVALGGTPLGGVIAAVNNAGVTNALSLKATTLNVVDGTDGSLLGIAANGDLTTAGKVITGNGLFNMPAFTTAPTTTVNGDTWLEKIGAGPLYLKTKHSGIIFSVELSA